MAKTEFNPRRFLLLFGMISLMSFFIFSTSLLSTNLYSNLFAEETFDKGVQVASVSLEGLTYEEAVQRIKDRTNKWKEESQVVLLYQKQKVTISPESWVFQPEDSVKQANQNNGTLIASLNGDLVNEGLNEWKDSGLLEVLDKDLLFLQLKQIGESLKTGTTEVEVNEFLTTAGQPDEIVSESSIELSGELPLLDEWVEALNGYEIKSGGSFSLLEAIEEKGMTAQDSIDINVLGSAIYSAVLKTNFEFTERHISRQLPEYVELGYETYVNPIETDLAFQNPNPTSYALELFIQDGKLSVSVVGIQLPQPYRIVVKKEEFEPKTIIHFNENLSYFSSSVLVEAGRKGYLGKVYRVSYDEAGKESARVKLFEDFYPPKHRIEERGYPVEPSEGEEIEEGMPVEGIPNDGTMPPVYPYYPYPQNPANLDPFAPVLPSIPTPTDKVPNGNEGETSEGQPQGGVSK
jgi:VanW like protein